MAYPLQYDSKQEVDFVDLLTNVSYRTGHQLVRLAFCTCCLVLLVVGKADGQAAPAPVAPSTRPSSADTSTIGVQNTTASAPSTIPVAGQGEADISSPPIQDRVPANPEPRSAATPAQLTEFQALVRESSGGVLPIFGADLFNSPPSTFAQTGRA